MIESICGIVCINGTTEEVAMCGNACNLPSRHLRTSTEVISDFIQSIWTKVHKLTLKKGKTCSSLAASNYETGIIIF